MVGNQASMAEKSRHPFRWFRLQPSNSVNPSQLSESTRDKAQFPQNSEPNPAQLSRRKVFVLSCLQVLTQRSNITIGGVQIVITSMVQEWIQAKKDFDN